MPRIAYRDESPWIRCECGYILGSDTEHCPGCHKSDTVEYRDRFAWNIGVTEYDALRKIAYLGVKYEDANRRAF